MVSSVAERISVLEEQAKKIFEEIVPLWEKHVEETRFLSDEAREDYFDDLAIQLVDCHDKSDTIDQHIMEAPMQSGSGNMTDDEILRNLFDKDHFDEFKESEFYTKFVETNPAALEFVGKLLAEQEDPIPY
jgi:hypothetical protein